MNFNIVNSFFKDSLPISDSSHFEEWIDDFAADISTNIDISYSILMNRYHDTFNAFVSDYYTELFFESVGLDGISIFWITFNLVESFFDGDTPKYNESMHYFMRFCNYCDFVVDSLPDNFLFDLYIRLDKEESSIPSFSSFRNFLRESIIDYYCMAFDSYLQS